MNYNELYEDEAEDFMNYVPTYHHVLYRQPEPVAQPIVIKPNECFYVHIKDATSEYFPAFMLNFRRKFNAKSMEQNYQRAINLRHEILRERVERLTARLANVAKLTAECHAKKKRALLTLRKHIVKDMQDHVQRHERYKAKRVEHLKRHNEQVQRLCELLRYGLYLTRIAEQYEEKRKRIGLF